MITRLILIPKGYTSTSKNGCGGPNMELVVAVGWGGVITDEYPDISFCITFGYENNCPTQLFPL